MSAKAFKALLGPDRYKPFTDFIKEIAPQITCKWDYDSRDMRVLHWGEWFNRKLGYSAIDPFCDLKNEWLPKYADFFKQHFREIEASDL